MKTIHSFVLSTFLVFNLSAQNYERAEFDPSILDSYYLAVKPTTDELNGVLVLLPGFGQDAESIFPESKLHNVAYANGILTIAIAGGRKLYADESVIEKLNQALEHVKTNYNVSANQFVIGGYSAGGTISLRYAEYCNQYSDTAPIQPKGVFAVDSPVDLFGIWNYFQREIRKDYSEAGVGEAKFISEIMINEIGEPETNKDKYNELTPFSSSLTEPGNEQYLTSMAVRFYEDIDVTWQLKNRRRSLYDSNALDASELINRLLLQGNENAEFLTSKSPGYRSSGLRHPHSWSIVDEVELIQWSLRVLSE